MALVFLKLGGSLITDKTVAETPRLDVLRRLAQETAAALAAQPGLRLLLGHGSGSFGHTLAARYGTRQGVRTDVAWRGFAATSRAAARLNRLVADAFGEAGVPVWSLAPSASARCRDGRLVGLALHPMQAALAHGLVPLVYGDVALDDGRGGTIVSTEDVFAWLAQRLHPDAILLAGLVGGVYAGDPLANPGAQLLPRLTPAMLGGLAGSLGGSFATDVTGGMESKVRSMASLLQDLPDLTIRFFSAAQPGNLQQVLCDPAAAIGTVLLADS